MAKYRKLREKQDSREMHEERPSQESKQRVREKIAASFLRGGPEAWLCLMGSFDILLD